MTAYDPMDDPSLRATADFIDHITGSHGFGTGDPMTDVTGLTSPATRAYHAHLHQGGQQNHTHDEAELARWRP